MEPTHDNPPEAASEAKPGSSARERFQARRGTKPKSTAKPRAASPTRSIEPGLIHYRIAEGILRGVRDKAEERGLTLDVGEFPPTTDVEPGDEDPQRLAKLTAHAIARVADRFTFVRKVTRHFEGTERRAGILSDISAALWILYRRNPDAVEELGRQFKTELDVRRQAATAKQAEKQSTTNGGTPNHATV